MGEYSKAGKILGWWVEAARGKGRIVAKGDCFEIARAECGKMSYRVLLPELTQEEALLIRAVIERFRDDQKKASAKNAVAGTLDAYCNEQLVVLDEEQKIYMPKILELLVFGYGPLSILLADDTVEEIAVIGIGQEKPVHVYHAEHGWLCTNIYFSGAECVRNLVNKMARKLGRRLTMQKPTMNAVLEDGSRLNAAIEPVAVSGPAVTIRKFRAKRFTPVDLVNAKTASAEAMAFLWMAMQSDCSVLVCGNTGSGKTTTLNALFAFVPADERIVVTEETPEIWLPHRHVIKLAVAPELGIGMRDLIVDTLRMRPDRVIVGEIRNSEEVSAFVDTLLAGQGKASFATFHAQSAQEALTRFARLGVAKQDLSGIDLIVVQRRWTRNELESGARKELRRVVEIAEVLGKNSSAGLNVLYRYDYQKDALEKTGDSVNVGEKAMRAFGIDCSKLECEVKRRAAMLSKLCKTNPGMGELFGMLNKNEGAKIED